MMCSNKKNYQVYCQKGWYSARLSDFTAVFKWSAYLWGKKLKVIYIETGIFQPFIYGNFYEAWGYKTQFDFLGYHLTFKNKENRNTNLWHLLSCWQSWTFMRRYMLEWWWMKILNHKKTKKNKKNFMRCTQLHFFFKYIFVSWITE